MIARLTRFLNRSKDVQELADAVEKELDNITRHAVADDPAGATGTFTTADTPAKTVTVTHGLITKIE